MGSGEMEPEIPQAWIPVSSPSHTLVPRGLDQGVRGSRTAFHRMMTLRWPCRIASLGGRESRTGRKYPRGVVSCSRIVGWRSCDLL